MVYLFLGSSSTVPVILNFMKIVTDMGKCSISFLDHLYLFLFVIVRSLLYISAIFYISNKTYVSWRHFANSQKIEKSVYMLWYWCFWTNHQCQDLHFFCTIDHRDLQVHMSTTILNFDRIQYRRGTMYLDVWQYCDVGDVNRIEGLRFRFDVGHYCDLDSMSSKIAMSTM